jgi:hypothetical protein
MAVGPTLQRLLDRYGLSGLAEWASKLIQTGASEAEIEIQLYDQPLFIARYPAISAREKAGLPPISVDEYMSYENTLSNLSLMWDIPLSKEEIDTALTLGTSAVEMEQRFGLAVGIIYEAPLEDREEAKRLYGVNDGQLAEYWMDPTKNFAELERQYISSRIAGAAVRSGFGQIERTEAERLASVGLTPDAAIQGFGELYSRRELFAPLNAAEDEITREEQLEALGGDQRFIEEIEDRQATRVAEFGGGGEFAAGGEGFKGTGSAKS